MDLMRMRSAVEDFLSSMDGISDDNDFGHVVYSAGLINAASYCKKFCLRASDKGSVMDCFDKGTIVRVDMRDGCGNIIFDASVRYDEGRLGFRRATKNHFVEFTTTNVVTIFYFFVDRNKRKSVRKDIRDTITRRKFMIDRRKRRKNTKGFGVSVR